MYLHACACMRALCVLIPCVYDFVHKVFVCIYSIYSMVDVYTQAGILKITYLGLWLRKCMSSSVAFLSPGQTRPKGST